MNFDLAIIGAGWAGFNAALKAKNLGLKVALIERNQIGGTCLNRGCIPTKALIQAAKVYSLTRKANNFGIEISSEPRINFLKIQERKDKLIQQLRSGMQSRLSGIEFIDGQAQIISDTEVKVDSQVIQAKFILIATGSIPVQLPGIEFDGKKIISSDEALNLKELPKNILIIGSGVIGCEFASLFSSLGVSVHLVEKMPQILPGLDPEVAKKLETIFKKRKIRIDTNIDAKTIELKNYDLVLVSVGRAPDKKIIVDDYLRTGASNIYAAGDCTGKIMLAHFAAYQGELAVENMLKRSPNKIDYANVPSCIFTDPEIASVGISEEEAKNKGVEVKINKFDFLGSGMARILDEAEGFIKIISNLETNEIIGGSIIGPKATELISILTLAVTAHLKTSQVKEAIFAHPTLTEAIKETL